MRILIIGGTIFLGRHIRDAALARGHSVTIFHRGQHALDAATDIQEILGDRENPTDLARLASDHWDAIIDTCAYIPRQIRLLQSAFATSPARYVFISTISVYPDATRPGADETFPVAALPPTADEDQRASEWYGPLKARCEATVQAWLPDRGLIIRPGLIVGPYDPTDRFTYWPRRIATGGEVLAPGRPARTVQFIDVRDLAEWTIRAVESSLIGTYNATGPAKELSMGETLATTTTALKSDATCTWVEDRFLLESDIAPWIELPLWIPEPEMPGLMTINNSRAVAAGLTFRALAATVSDTLAWDRQRPTGTSYGAGLAAEKERAVLAHWHARET